jgi:hypothetical protein
MSGESIVEEENEEPENNEKVINEIVISSELPPGSWAWVVERFKVAHNPTVSAHPPCKFISII